MTLQQKGIIAGAIVAIFITDGLQIKLIHATPRIPIMMICIWTMLFGISIGQKLHKWKRDKEMASIVAERLLRKPQPPLSNTQYGNLSGMTQSGLAAGIAQQSGGMLSGVQGRGLSTTSSQGPNLDRMLFSFDSPYDGSSK